MPKSTRKNGGVVTVLGGNRYLVPSDRGIATPVCALVRNDSKNDTNTNLSGSAVVYGNVTVTVVPFPDSLSRVIFAP